MLIKFCAKIIVYYEEGVWLNMIKWPLLCRKSAIQLLFILGTIFPLNLEMKMCCQTAFYSNEKRVKLALNSLLGSSIDLPCGQVTHARLSSFSLLIHVIIKWWWWWSILTNCA